MTDILLKFLIYSRIYAGIVILYIKMTLALDSVMSFSSIVYNVSQHAATINIKIVFTNTCFQSEFNGWFLFQYLLLNSIDKFNQSSFVGVC